jgi:hypothetical protein
MMHSFAGPFQQSCQVLQVGATKESHVYVGSEGVDLCERRISHTDDRTTVMHAFSNIFSTGPHHVEPVSRDGAQLRRSRIEPEFNSGIPFYSAGKLKQLVHSSVSVGETTCLYPNDYAPASVMSSPSLPPV